MTLRRLVSGRIVALASAGLSIGAVVGTATPAAAISGGAPAAPGQFPWAAAVISATEPAERPEVTCSGVVVSPHWVLTAGHCAGPRSGRLHVVTGRPTLSGGGGRRIGVDRVVRMPGYRNLRRAPVHDVSLLHLTSATTSPAVRLALPSESRTITAGTQTLAAGWGLADPDWVKQDRLRWTRLAILPASVCRAAYGSRFVPTDHLCAGWDWPRMTHDTCTGDSGGPLLMRTARGWVLVATTSWGDSCGTPNVPGAYMKTSTARCWVSSVIGAAAAGCPGTRARSAS